MLIFDYRPMGTRSTVLSNSPTFSSFSFCRRCKIVTGIMMSPALAARFPWFPGIFGGRQAARSLHFIGLILFVGFIVIHISMVVAHGFALEMAKIVLGGESHSHAIAVTIGLIGIAGVIAFHFLGTWYSLAFPFRAKRLLELGVDPLRRFLFHHLDSRQNYQHVSAYALVNGRPPRNETYERLAAANFKELATGAKWYGGEEVKSLPR